MDDDGIGGGREVGLPPNVLIEGSGSEVFSAGGGQTGKEEVLTLGQFHPLALFIDGLFLGIPLHIPREANDTVGFLGGNVTRIAVHLKAAEHGLDLEAKIGGVKGLDYVIVSAIPISCGFIRVGGAGGEEQDGGIGPFPQGAGGLEAVQIGHHDVQQDKGNILVILYLLQGFQSVGGLQHAVAVLFQ